MTETEIDAMEVDVGSSQQQPLLPPSMASSPPSPISSSSSLSPPSPQHNSAQPQSLLGSISSEGSSSPSSSRPPPPSPMRLARTQFERFTLPPFESHTHVRVLDHLLNNFPANHHARPDLHLHVSPHATALAINAGEDGGGDGDNAQDDQDGQDDQTMEDSPGDPSSSSSSSSSSSTSLSQSASSSSSSLSRLLPLPPPPAAHRRPRADLGPDLGRLPPEVLELVLLQHLDLDTLVRGVLLVNRAAHALVRRAPAYRAVHTHALMALHGMLALDTARYHSCTDLYAVMCEPRCARCGDPMGGYVYLLTCTRACLACLRSDGRFQPLTMRQAERMYNLGEPGAPGAPEAPGAAPEDPPHKEKLAKACAARANEMPWRYPVQKSLASLIRRELRGGWPEPDLSLFKSAPAEKESSSLSSLSSSSSSSSSSFSSSPLVSYLPCMRIPARLYCAPSTAPEMHAALPAIQLVDHGAAYWAGVARQGGSEAKATAHFWRPLAGVWQKTKKNPNSNLNSNSSSSSSSSSSSFPLPFSTPPMPPPQTMPSDFARFYGYQFLAVSRVPWLRLRGGQDNKDAILAGGGGQPVAVEWGAGCRACWAEEENRLSPHHVLRLYTPELFAEHVAECGQIEGGLHVG